MYSSSLDTKRWFSGSNDSNNDDGWKAFRPKATINWHSSRRDDAGQSLGQSLTSRPRVSDDSGNAHHNRNSNQYYQSSNSSSSSQLNNQAYTNRRQGNFNPNYQRNPHTSQLLSELHACRTIDETLQLANDNIHNLSPRATDAVWKHVLSLLNKPSRINRETGDDSVQYFQLDNLFDHTVNCVDRCSPVDLSYLAQTIASIIKAVYKKGHPKNRGYNDHQRLYCLLLNDNTLFWEKIQSRSLLLMSSLRPKWLVSIAWSYATALDPINANSRVPLDVSPFFQVSSDSFKQRKHEFSSKHISNLAWACMSCRQSNSVLMRDIADEFVSRREYEMDERCEDVENIDAVTLCQIANSFAKAGYNDERLFQSISDATISILTSFDARHLANMAYAFALARVNPRYDDGLTLFDDIANEFIPRLHTATTQHLANITWAYATIGHANPDLFGAVAEEAMGRLKEFSPQHLENLSWALSKFPHSSNEILDRIAEEVVARGLQCSTSQGIAMLAHSFATLNHATNGDFWECIENTASSRVSSFGVIECIQIAWAFATIGRKADDLFRGIERVSMSKMDQFNPQGLSNLAWAFSTLEYDSPTLFNAIAECSERKLDQFKPQEKAMLVLALSRIDRSFPDIFDTIASQSASELDKFSSLDLFNLVVSYVKAGQQSEQWLLAIESEILRRSHELKPQMLVGVAWAYAAAGYRSPALFNYISDVSVPHCNDLKRQEVASLAWSFAALNFFHRPLLEALAVSSEGRWEEFSAQNLANMAWAYTTAQETRHSLLRGIADAAIKKHDEFTHQGFSNLLWAYAAAGHPHQRLFSALAPSVAEVLDTCNGQSLANIAWAFAVSNVNDELLFSDRFVDVCSSKIDEFNSEGLCQLHQWNIWRAEIGSDKVLPPMIAKKCYTQFTSQPLQGSNLQSDAMKVLTSMDLHPIEEVQTESGYCLDFVVNVDGEELGIEVDGPHHFVGRDPTGSTLLKRRHVENVDRIPIISLPYWELNELETLDDKQLYLRSKLGIS